MITDAINTDGKLAFTYPMWASRLSPDSNPPTKMDEVSKTLIPRVVMQSAGGQELDSADLQWIISEPLTERTQPADFTKMVDVLLDNKTKDRMHLGDYVTENETVSADIEALAASSQLRPYHFGDPLAGEVWLNPLTDTQETVKKPIEFNPNIDGVPIASMSDAERDDGNSKIWIHPHAAHTTRSQTYNTQTPSKWTLEEAIKAVCWHCNPDETIIRNPTDFSSLTSAPDLEAVTIDRGQYMPAYLDGLLHPLGYNWFLDYGSTAGTDGATKFDKQKPQIRLFQKGVGTEKKLYHQAPGNDLDLSETNLAEYTIARHIGDMQNAVRVLGDYERREITIELYPAWPESQDTLTADELKKSETGSRYTQYPTVWRLWAANEDGGLKDLRTTTQPAGDPPDLTTVFTNYTPHRRRLEPPLTYQGESGEKTRRDVFVETSNNGGGWTPYAGTVAILPDQIGILFSEDKPPPEAMGDTARVRVTGTIAGDFRIEGEATRQSSAVNGRNVWLELDRPEKFVDRAVQTTGTWASELSGPADEQDDTAAITTYAEKLRDEAGHAEIDCEFKLPGIHLYYEIGDLLTTIEGRNVTLDQASSGAGTSVYVQVTKRTFRWDQNGPVTVLTVDRGTKIVSENDWTEEYKRMDERNRQRQLDAALKANPRLASYI